MYYAVFNYMVQLRDSSIVLYMHGMNKILLL